MPQQFAPLTCWYVEPTSHLRYKKKIQQQDMGAVWDVPNAFQKPPHSHAVNKNLTAFSLNKVKMRKAFISAVCTQKGLEICALTVLQMLYVLKAA